MPFYLVYIREFHEISLPKLNLKNSWKLCSVLQKCQFQIVFVASNFVSERGDMAILDDIEVIYESDGDDCGIEQEEGKAQTIEKPAATVENGTKQDPLGASNVSSFIHNLVPHKNFTKIEMWVLR